MKTNGTTEQVQRREPEALGAESCSGVGVTVKVMGRVMVDSGHVKVPAKTQYLSIMWTATPRETLHDGTKINNNPPWVALGHGPPAFFLWLCTNVHVHPGLFWFLYKDGSPGTPAILRPAFFA